MKSKKMFLFFGGGERERERERERRKREKKYYQLTSAFSLGTYRHLIPAISVFVVAPSYLVWAV